MFVTNKDESIVWEIQHLHKIVQSPDGDEYEVVELYWPYYWTHDSQYLYFQPYVCCIDAFTLGSLPRSLVRLDIQSGFRNIFIRESASDVTFSPKNKYVAYFTNDHSKLNISIHSLKNGNVDIYMLEE